MAMHVKQTEKLRELCRLMHMGDIALIMHDHGRGLRIQWREDFVQDNREETGRIQELVYRDEEMVPVIGRLVDGLYGAVQLWNYFEKGKDR